MFQGSCDCDQGWDAVVGLLRPVSPSLDLIGEDPLALLMAAIDDHRPVTEAATEQPADRAAAGPGPPPSSRRHPPTSTIPLWRLLAIVAAVGGVLLATRPLTDPDIWWHVRLGDLIRQSGVPHRELWSYPILGDPWHPTAWLTDVLLSFLHAAGGWRAIVLFKVVLAAAILVTLYPAGHPTRSGRDQLRRLRDRRGDAWGSSSASVRRCSASCWSCWSVRGPSAWPRLVSGGRGRGWRSPICGATCMAGGCSARRCWGLPRSLGRRRVASRVHPWSRWGRQQSPPCSPSSPRWRRPSDLR